MLAIANYNQLPKKTFIFMASGVLPIRPFWTFLGTEKTKALPAFHAFSGADNTGKFARIGKSTWFKIILEASDDVINAFGMLSVTGEVTETIQSTIATFLRRIYSQRHSNNQHS